MVKKILIALLIILVAIGAIIGKLVYDIRRDVAYQKKTETALVEIMSGTTKRDEVDYQSLGKYSDFLKEFSDGLLKLDEDTKGLEDTINQPNFKQILDLTYIQDPESGKKNIKLLRATISDYQSRFNKDMDQCVNSLKNLPLSDNKKSNLTASFQKKKNETTKKIDITVNMLNSVLAKTDAVFDFLLSKQGKYSIQNGKVVFNNKGDSDSFRNMMLDYVKSASEIVSSATESMKSATESTK